MTSLPVFPAQRPRRLRGSATLRRMVRETALSPDDFIYPIFVEEGSGIREEVPSMPGVMRVSPDRLEDEAAEVVAAEIPAVILFGIPAEKDEAGSGAYDDEGVVQQAIRLLSTSFPDLLAIADVCMCEYTSHGHCGLLADGDVHNDRTLPLLVRSAVSMARAGAGMIAPSDMMDGRVQAIRRGLDEAGFEGLPIMSYAAKFASAYYGPFRDAANSAPAFGDRRGYQMDPSNGREALKEVALDIQEGADIVMVKPALAYMDVIRQVRDLFHVPVAAYNVSGEYAMVKAAAARGWIDEQRVVLETLTSMKRAGADMILTYHAKDASRWLAR